MMFLWFVKLLYCYLLPTIETYLIACLVNYFSTQPDFVDGDKGVRKGDLFMSWESIFSDVRNTVDWVHLKVRTSSAVSVLAH